MTHMARIVHMGSAIVDLTYEIDRVPAAATEVQATRAHVDVGGAFNVMAAARAYGVAVVYAGRHGNGPFGERVRARLGGAGIEVVQPISDDGDTGTCVVLVDADAERTFVTNAGVESRLERGDLERVDVMPGDYVVLSGYMLSYPASRDALCDWADALPSHCTVVFDPGPLVQSIPRPLLERTLRRADWLSCNADEAFALSGEREPLQALQAMRRTFDLAGAGVLLRLGANGCLVDQDRRHADHVPGMPVAAIDANGAGDTHLGNFVAKLIDGCDALDAARYANAAAAYAVTRRGGAVAPDPKTVAAFIRSHHNG
ncbi:PfkB family carbohydrate kinase [Burkholderia stagnalis]|uniref:Ribokinase n=1 Tax=Burkholderia stagnalis TaxID=1503054 RepID=A0A6L3N0D2_9BURK|nr:PfkB family carbohydrate kinase [Burkholderia stagnalis]KAB0639333.1 ribokinase [Burkholderia stagnalis]VWB55838.1 putative ribokinase [Burkholderia stagnalis]